MLNLLRSYISNKDWDAVSATHRGSQDDIDKMALAYILVERNTLISKKSVIYDAGPC